MGIRFRKRIKILPGVNVSFSKSGISTTVGIKGASVNIGKNGVYGNAGIPGTGIYMREKLSGKKKRNNHADSYNNIHSQNDIPAGCFATIAGAFSGLAFGLLSWSFSIGLLIGAISFSLAFLIGWIIKKCKENDE